MQHPAMQFVVAPEHGGDRLDRLIQRQAGMSRREARSLIATGQVQVNRRTMRILTRPIAAGASISMLSTTPVAPVAEAVSRGSAEHAPLEILYIDRYMVAVAKPPRLLSEHDRFCSPSLETVLPKLLEKRGENPRLWLVHRLDAGTSGVIVLARTPTAVANLNATFRDAKAQKTYLALCQGEMRHAFDVDAPIARAERTRHCVRDDGKAAQTYVQPVQRGGGATLVQALPRTGRTHQIRVHMAHLGHPLLGDRLYGGAGYTKDTPPASIGRAMLHAQRLVLPHPIEERTLELQAEPPEDFMALAKSLGLTNF